MVFKHKCPAVYKAEDSFSSSRIRSWSWGVCLLIVLGGGLLSGSSLVGQQNTEEPAVESNLGNSKKSRAAQQIREGTELKNVIGRFRLQNNRIVFLLERNQGELIGLENLIMERVASILDKEVDTVEWMVSGRVTEFRGANYLLVSKAILQTSGTQKKIPPSNDKAPSEIPSAVDSSAGR